jgi:hypothetical protein
LSTQGSNNLTPEQQAYWQNRFGIKYSTVPTQPFVQDSKTGKIGPAANRAERRRLRKG